jgi:uncharacterized protein YodC (DUF2158 family)
MSPVTRQVLIAIVLTLGFAPGAPWSIPAFADSTSPGATAMNAAAPALRTGDHVRVRSGGPLMTVVAVNGDQVNCSWTDWNGEFRSEAFPADVLSVPVTAPPFDPNL